jgi:acyl-coenzyme A thioesterase PaaI-like protein
MTQPAASHPLRQPEPFAEISASSIIEAEPRRAVAEQRPAPELENHAGVRHAGALFAVGYAASRALIGAALAAHGDLVRARMVDSEIAYEKVVGAELVTATAEPGDDDWDALLERAGSEGVQLPTSVTLRDERGQTVTAMAVCWQAGPSSEGEDE